MAYLDIDAGAPSFGGQTVTRASERKLNAQERMVVLLSRADPLWSIEPRRHFRFLSFLFGIEAPHALADPRLEALRRYAVTYRERGGDIEAREQAAAEAGFAPARLRQVRAMVDGARAVRTPRSPVRIVRSIVLSIAAALALYGATAWIGPSLGSGLMAFIFVAVASLAVTPFLAKGREPVRHA